LQHKKAKSNMSAKEYFLKFVSFDTRSDEASTATPSTPGQRIFAEYLAQLLKEIGMEDVTLDDNCYVMATLPGPSPAIGFIAHLDTSPDLSGKDVKPQLIDYQGNDIVLNKEYTLSPSIFPELNDYIGQELIVTDGTTLLGADDKAGVAAIVAAMQYLIENKDIKHRKIRIAFTPDEEIGRGADKFDVKKFGCEWAYTIDGGAIGELEYENFNAAAATVTVKGCNIHPGYAKDKMRNAIDEAFLFNLQLPEDERPETTEGYEGFIHLTAMIGTVDEATLKYIIRDHDKQKFEDKKDMLRDIANRMKTVKDSEITVEIRDQYYNMREKVEPRREIIDLASEAMRKCGVEPVIKPIRGGTDGARLSFMGLPCPNIFTGGHNFHGRYEFLPVRSLEKCCETIIEIIKSTNSLKI